MPNLASLLKSEISRLARKEIRQEVAPLKRAATSLRSEVAALKKQVRALQQELKNASRATRANPADEKGDGSKVSRFSASRLKTHRAKTGLSAKDYAALIGTTPLSVYKWESGRATPRPNMTSKISAVLGLGKREAARRLEAIRGP